MKRRDINPTRWLLAFGINQGVEVAGAQRTLYLSGQTSCDEHGNPVHAGDLAAQFSVAWSCLKDTLGEAGMTAENILRLNIYTTDVPGFMAVAGELMPIIGADGCRPASTLLGVAALFHPDIMIELEATAVA